MSGHLAILAFGSLIDDPGYELESLIVERKPVKTPFRVEFARQSSSRAGAPTLVPVCCEGIGTSVQAQLLVLEPGVSVEKAMDMFYRREIHRVGSGKRYNDEKARQRKSGVRIERLAGFEGIETVLYASLPVNLEWVCDPNLDLQIKAERLAEMAIQSVTPQTYQNGKDGIRYLELTIVNGITTPLTEPYRKAILCKTGTETLSQAREVALQRNEEEK